MIDEQQMLADVMKLRSDIYKLATEFINKYTIEFEEDDAEKDGFICLSNWEDKLDMVLTGFLELMWAKLMRRK